MANPLSAYGVSDQDYAAAIGTAMGEAYREGIAGMAAVMDVIANRMENPRAYGARSASIHDVAHAPRQFDANRQQFAGAYDIAVRGATAALDPEFAAQQSRTFQQNFAQAQTAALGVFGLGTMRGITRGADMYGNHAAMSAARIAEHMGRAPNGAVQIGNHTFVGPNVDPSRPFDFNAALVQTMVGIPASPGALPLEMQNPELMAELYPDVAPVFNAPISPVQFGASLPDLSPVSMPVDPVQFGGGLIDLSAITAPVSPVALGGALEDLSPNPLGVPGIGMPAPMNAMDFASINAPGFLGSYDDFDPGMRAPVGPVDMAPLGNVPETVSVNLDGLGFDAPQARGAYEAAPDIMSFAAPESMMSRAPSVDFSVSVPSVPDPMSTFASIAPQQQQQAVAPAVQQTAPETIEPQAAPQPVDMLGYNNPFNAASFDPNAPFNDIGKALAVAPALGIPTFQAVDMGRKEMDRKEGIAPASRAQVERQQQQTPAQRAAQQMVAPNPRPTVAAPALGIAPLGGMGGAGANASSYGISGLAPSVMSALAASGLGAPGDGMSYGYSPFGGFSQVHSSAPEYAQIAATGPGLFGAFGDFFGNPFGGLFGDLFGGSGGGGFDYGAPFGSQLGGGWTFGDITNQDVLSGNYGSGGYGGGGGGGFGPAEPGQGYGGPNWN